jgi:precorrin-6A synthase
MRVKQVRIIGMGAGDPEWMTVQAINALNAADVLFFFDKGEDKEELLGLRREICGRFLTHDRHRIVEAQDPQRDLSGPAYGAAVSSWQDQRVALWEQLIETELADGEVGAVLTWGDPAFYDGTLRILESVRIRGASDLAYDAIPGISALQALASRHNIALTQTASSVVVTTGRQLREIWATGISDVVVMVDPACSFMELADHDTMIYWGAFLGTPDEILLRGTIAQRGAEIQRRRIEARAAKGWMFDTYLLRRQR